MLVLSHMKTRIFTFITNHMHSLSLHSPQLNSYLISNLALRGYIPQGYPKNIFCYTEDNEQMSQHTLGVNLCSFWLPIIFSKCKSGTTPTVIKWITSKKESKHSLLNERGSIKFHRLYKTLHVIKGWAKHGCSMFYSLNHACCPTTRTIQIMDTSLPYKCKTKTCFLKWTYTNTHTPSMKGITRKRNWKKIFKNGKGYKTKSKMHSREWNKKNTVLWFLEIQGKFSI